MYNTEKNKTPIQEDGATANFNSDFSTQTHETQAVSKEKRVEMAKNFLLYFYLHCGKDKDYFTYLWIKHHKNEKDKKTIAFNATDFVNAAKTAIDWNDKGYDVYFGVNLTDSPMDAHTRAKEKDITAQVAIVADLDCKSAWHADTDKKKFPTIEQAKTFLPFQPSILVSSGGGLHSYIMLNEPLKFATDDDKNLAHERNKNYVEMIRANAKAQGYTGVDSVFDFARVLRLPGTFNLKNGVENAPLCKVLDYENLRNYKEYSISDLNTLIKKNVKKDSDSTRKTFNDSNSAQKDFGDFTNNADYDQWRALKMLDCIPCSAMSYDDWRSIGMALKNNGNSLTNWENWSATDSARFKVGECEYKWKDFNDKGLTIATIHSYAKDYGYDEKATRREWYELHPEYQTKGNAWQNSDFAQDKDSATDENNRADDNTNSEETADKETPKLDDTEKFALFSLPHTDLYNSRRILIFHGKNIRYLTDSGKWYTYNNNVWKDGGKENGAILPFALNVADLIFHNADLREESGTEEKLKKAWQSRKTISNAIELLKGENKIRITEQDLNTHKNLLNCKNCVVDLETGKTYKHNSKLLLTQCVNAEYRKGYYNEVVDKFLRDVLPDTETLKALLRYLGYCLTGEVSAEKALFIHGSGGNGKGTLTKMLFNLLGDYSCGFPIESILTQPYNRNDGDSATPAFNKLQWRRLAVAEEIPAGRKLDYAKFKILTGGDALPIRKLHQEATEIKDPVHKFIFSGNHLPELDDAHDAGILRRWIQIKFEQDFTGDKGDETLKQRLQTQDSLSALLTLLVENSIEWYKSGLIISDKMKADRNNYFAENDFISEFISEFCVRGNGLSVKRTKFLEQLKNEYPNETRGKSDRRLTSAVAKIEGIDYRRGGKDGGNRFYNIGLRDLQENSSK